MPPVKQWILMPELWKAKLNCKEWNVSRLRDESTQSLWNLTDCRETQKSNIHHKPNIIFVVSKEKSRSHCFNVKASFERKTRTVQFKGIKFFCGIDKHDKFYLNLFQFFIKSQRLVTPACTVSGVPGVPGVPGLNGRDGAKGDQGPVGAPGKRGPKGSLGEPGKKGSKGSSGTKGDQGPLGPPGKMGAKGAQGDKGKQGPHCCGSSKKLETVRMEGFEWSQR